MHYLINTATLADTLVNEFNFTIDYMDSERAALSLDEWRVILAQAGPRWSVDVSEYDEEGRCIGCRITWIQTVQQLVALVKEELEY